jgi:subtilisin family serine protease
VGGKTYGVAKGAQLVAVRVLDCKGEATVSEVIAGVNWVTKERKRNPQSLMVANMSLGGPVSAALDKAIANSIAAGMPYVIAAGNNYGMSACNLTPARVPTAITVGATMSLLDLRAFYSNIGSCLDLFAPGSAIQAAWFTSDTSIKTLSGTSMAAPHVTGAAAIYLQIHPKATPKEVADALLANTTPDVVLLAGTRSPNRLLFVP